MTVRVTAPFVVSLVAGLALGASVPPAHAQEPDVTTIVARMKEALEPPRPLAARLKLTVGAGREQTTLTLGMARAQHPTGSRLLLVVLAPEGLRRTGYLVGDGSTDTPPQWVYLPFIRRVRKIVAPEAFRSFLNSDFTYSDLGFVDLKSTYTLRGRETVSGSPAYRIQAVPQRWYYGEIVTLVDATTFLPIEREYYDPSGSLWKKQRWDQITVIDGVATPMQITMQDVQANTTSSITFTGIRYDAEVTADMMTPEALPLAADAPVWKTVGVKPPTKRRN